MVAALRQQGVEASILTTNDHGPGVQAAMPLGRWHQQQALGQAVPVLAFGRWDPPVRAAREFAIAPGFSRWLGQHAREYELVHVHALFSYTTSVGMAQLRRQGMPYFLRTIGQLSPWSLSQSAGRKRVFLNLVDRANLQGAAALHFTSEVERQEAAALGLRSPTFVLPLGVPEGDPHCIPAAGSDEIAQESARPTRFLFLSRIHPKKQLPLLFQALGQVQRRHPSASWQLDIAGDGDPAYLEELKHQAQAMGIFDRLHWQGFVSGAAKQALLQQADWFVLPSASENFGIAAAEALMAGTPVVLSPGVALAPEVAAAGAGLIANPTPEALSACLEQCLKPPSASMRAAARSLAQERYGWPAISRQLIQRYEEMIRG